MGSAANDTAPATGFAAAPDGVRIAFSDTGGDNVALVFVHGWSCDRSYWNAQRSFFETGYRVVQIDLAGHGDSGLARDNWTIDAFGQDVLAVIEVLELDDVVLIGHSLGGPVVVSAANQQPERVVTVVGVDTFKDIATVYSQQELDFFEAGLKQNFSADVQRMADAWFPGELSALPLKQVIIDDMSTSPLEAAIPSALSMASFDYGTELSKLTPPLRLINATVDDRLYDPIRALKSDFAVTSIDHASHFLMMQLPERFNSALEEALDELRSR